MKRFPADVAANRGASHGVSRSPACSSRKRPASAPRAHAGYPPPVLLFLVAASSADDATCIACCKAGGLGSCPTTIQVRTEKSGTEPVGVGWELQGAWVVACDGSGRFDPSINASFDHEPD